MTKADTNCVSANQKHVSAAFATLALQQILLLHDADLMMLNCLRVLHFMVLLQCSTETCHTIVQLDEEPSLQAGKEGRAESQLQDRYNTLLQQHHELQAQHNNLQRQYACQQAHMQTWKAIVTGPLCGKPLATCVGCGLPCHTVKHMHHALHRKIDYIMLLLDTNASLITIPEAQCCWCRATWAIGQWSQGSSTNLFGEVPLMSASEVRCNSLV